jgi:LPS O-antigen subunit length determinant protein (WzzB/FepE family)
MKKYIPTLISIAIVVTIAFIAGRHSIILQETNTPSTSITAPSTCSQVLAIYRNKADKLLHTVAHDKKAYDERANRLTAEINNLCELDFTNDEVFTEYPKYSPLNLLYEQAHIINLR